MVGGDIACTSGAQVATDHRSGGIDPAEVTVQPEEGSVFTAEGN